MQFNYKTISLLMFLCLALMVVTLFVVDGVHAESNSFTVVNASDIFNPFADNTTLQSSTVSNQSHYIPAYKNNTRIEQGQCVEINGMYDVSGVIGFSTTTSYNAFAWYGRYENAYDPYTNDSTRYTYILPNNKAAYFDFIITPEVFSERQGYWYQYTGTSERAANKRAFYVSDRCIRPVNETVVTASEQNILLNPKYIEPRKVSDILVSNDEPLFLNETGYYQTWVFGNTKWVKGHKLYITQQYPTLDINVTKYLFSGSYSLVLQNYGGDTIYGVDYGTSDRNSTSQELLIPSLRAIPIADITGLQPSLILPILTGILDQTDDFYKVLKMEVQNPYVEIAGYQEIRYDNATLLEVAGYTNKAEGTPITVYIDRENQTGISLLYPSMTTITEAGEIGNYRTFHGYFPLFYEQLAPGFHTLTAVLPSGALSTVSFYIREEPKPHYTEPVYFKFVDGNPFYEPVIVEKEVIKEVPVIKEVIVKEPVDYTILAERQNQMMYDDIRSAIPKVAICIIGLILVLYLVSVSIRAYDRRKRNSVQTESKGEKK